MNFDSGDALTITKVQFDATLDNLEDFNDICSELFYIHGNPWQLTFELFPEDGCQRRSLAVWLRSEIDNTLEEWAVVGSFVAEIISNKFNGKSHVYELKPIIFEASSPGWGNRCWINWDELFDPEKGYVYKDKCKIAVTVKASPLQLPNDDKLLEFVPTIKCCDGSSLGEFRIKVNEVIDFVDVCSPKFTLKNFSWRLLIYKVVEMENGEKKYSLRIQLCNLLMKTEPEMSCEVTITCKLISFETSTEPFSKKLENRKFAFLNSTYHWNMITWNELMNPQKKFIQNNSFVLEIRIEVKETKEQETARALERAAKDKLNSITLECPICFQNLVDQSVSVLVCGHMFCTACITESLKQRRNCPSCNADVTVGELQKVYLPTK